MKQQFLKTSKALPFILILLLITSCKNESKADTNSQTDSKISEINNSLNTEKNGIIAQVNGETITTSEATSRATIITRDDFILVDIQGVTDDIKKQFQLKITSTNKSDLKNTHTVTDAGVVPIVSLRYIEYGVPGDMTTMKIWGSTSGEITVSKNTGNRFIGSFDVVVKNKKIGEKVIKGTFNVKKNPFGN